MENTIVLVGYPLSSSLLSFCYLSFELSQIRLAIIFCSTCIRCINPWFCYWIWFGCCYAGSVRRPIFKIYTKLSTTQVNRWYVSVLSSIWLHSLWHYSSYLSVICELFSQIANGYWTYHLCNIHYSHSVPQILSHANLNILLKLVSSSESII